MSVALTQSDPYKNTADLRSETQGMVTFYHSGSTPGYWFNAGEIESMIDQKCFLELPSPNKNLAIDDEFSQGPEHCPHCGSSSRLFAMKSYLSSEVLMRACHVCHGRWIGHNSLELLLENMKYQGFLGSLKRLFARPSSRVEEREA